MAGSNGAGKGDRYRHVDKKKFDENYKRIFGNREVTPLDCTSSVPCDQCSFSDQCYGDKK
jgi:hypothetical protein